MPPDTASTATPESQAAQPKATSFATPNFYRLSGGGIQISYRTEGFRAPFLTYQDPHHALTFSGDQVRVVDVPDLGTIVSVTLMLTVDSGSTTFSVLLPQVNLPNQLGASEPVRTEGITTMHRFSLFPPLDLGQREFYTVVALSGTASRVIVPL